MMLLFQFDAPPGIVLKTSSFIWQRLLAQKLYARRPPGRYGQVVEKSPSWIPCKRKALFCFSPRWHPRGQRNKADKFARSASDKSCDPVEVVMAYALRLITTSFSRIPASNSAQRFLFKATWAKVVGVKPLMTDMQSTPQTGFLFNQRSKLIITVTMVALGDTNLHAWVLRGGACSIAPL